MFQTDRYLFQGVSWRIVNLCACVYAVSSGSVTVNADSSVQLLAEEAVPLDQLDISVSIMSLYLHAN